MKNRQFTFAGTTYTIKNYDRVATDLYVDQPLTNLSIAYKNQDFIADLIVPKTQVTQETGIITKYGKENFRIPDMTRGDKARSKRSSYSVDNTGTYRIINYALNDVVTINEAAMAQGQNPEADTTEYLTSRLALNKEYLAASALFNTGSTGFSGYTEALSTTARHYRWDDYVNSTPIDDVSYAKRSKITPASGAASMFEGIVGANVMLALENHPDILERVKYTQTAILDVALIAKALKLDNLWVGNATYDSANEGQSASLSNVWGNYALIYHRGLVGLKTTACTALIHGGNVVRKWTEPQYRNQTVVEVEEAYQYKILAAESGYLFSTAVS